MSAVCTGVSLSRSTRCAFCWMAVLCCLAPYAIVQTAPYERTVPQSMVVVEKVLKELQSTASGRLPTLEGFAASGDRPLSRFQRGYYQCTAEVSSLPSGESRVRVSAKITAWYADPVASKSGYQVLPSNGRLESDFLDQLQEALATSPVAGNSPAKLPAVKSQNKPDIPAPTLSAPQPQAPLPIPGSKSSPPSVSPFKTGGAPDDLASSETRKPVGDSHVEELTKEAQNLEEIVRNQSHPNNLVAVKQSGTPVLVSANEGAKVLFLATAEDEFEMLDMNASWVHIRISGLSRGWILRSAVEMPEVSESTPEPQPAPPATQTPSKAAPATPFQVENEQVASFPGNWEPLRGRIVKIISVQEAKGRSSETGSQAKLDYAKTLFDREYVELTKQSTLAAGVVVVFDSEDGGMMAATLPVLQQWKSGALSDEALWRRCYFDPPETFHAVSMP